MTQIRDIMDGVVDVMDTTNLITNTHHKVKTLTLQNSHKLHQLHNSQRVQVTAALGGFKEVYRRTACQIDSHRIYF